MHVTDIDCSGGKNLRKFEVAMFFYPQNLSVQSCPICDSIGCIYLTEMHVQHNEAIVFTFRKEGL